jgi:hypothetical protein
MTLLTVIAGTGFAPGIAGAASSAALPLVASFAASPNSLPDRGGTVRLTASLKFARTCTLSVVPAVRGLPRTNFSCASGSFSMPFPIARDASANSRTYTFSLSVTNKEGTVAAPQVVVTEGAAPPPISFGIRSKNFGAIGVSIHSPNVEVQVTNNSNLPQTLGEFEIVGTNASDFTVTSNDCAGISLSPSGGECSFAVAFIPTSKGRRVATLELADSSWGTGGGNALLPLSGTGVFSQISISASSRFYSGGAVRFDTQGVGTTANPLYVSVTDASSTVPLDVTSISVSGQNYADFTVSPGNCETTVVDPRDACQFTVTFTPTASGLRRAEIDVYGNMSGGVWTIPETGTGQYATLSLVGPSGAPITAIDFGDTSSESANLLVKVTNTSSTVFLAFGSLSAVSGENASDFSWSGDDCAAATDELGPGQSCTFTVTFQPQVKDVEYDAIFTLSDNVASASQTLRLSGEWSS